MIEKLKTLAKLLNKKNIKWALIGSLSLKLQGINSLNPRDIDIITEDISKFQEIFPKKTEIKEFTSLLSSKTKRIKANIKSIELDIIEEKINNKDIITNYINNIPIPCMKLETQLLRYKKMNREEKVKLISDFLKLPSK